MTTKKRQKLYSLLLLCNEDQIRFFKNIHSYNTRNLLSVEKILNNMSNRQVAVAIKQFERIVETNLINCCNHLIKPDNYGNEHEDMA